MRRFGELEAVIMDRLWERDQPMLVREVVDALHDDRALAYTTVMTVMENLYRKGWLRRERDGRAWRYEPTGSRSSYTSALMNDALATSPDRRTALTHFALQMSPNDAALLREALEQALGKPEAGESRLTVAAALVAYSACLGILGPRMFGRARWTARAPLLAIVTYLAAGVVSYRRARVGRPDAGRSRDRTRRGAESPDRSLRAPAPRHLRHPGRRPGRRAWPHPGGRCPSPHRTHRDRPPPCRGAAGAACTRRPRGLSDSPSRPWGPCWSNTHSRLPTASPAGSPR